MPTQWFFIIFCCFIFSLYIKHFMCQVLESGDSLWVSQLSYSLIWKSRFFYRTGLLSSGNNHFFGGESPEHSIKVSLLPYPPYLIILLYFIHTLIYLSVYLPNIFCHYKVNPIMEEICICYCFSPSSELILLFYYMAHKNNFWKGE